MSGAPERTTGATSLPADATETKASASLADIFFGEGDYFRAITEYRRAIHAGPSEAERGRLWLRVGVAYARAARFADASRVFTRLGATAPTDALSSHACYALALTWLDAGLGKLARGQLARCAAAPAAVAVVGHGRLGLARALAAYSQRDYDVALRDLATLSALTVAPTQQTAARALQRAATEGLAIKPFRPWLAGAMSALIPGLGQLYLGRGWDATQAFVIVGAATVGTAGLARYELRQTRAERNWLLPIATGVIGAMFYGANVYGAANGARMETLLAQMRAVEAAREAVRPALDLPPP